MREIACTALGRTALPTGLVSHAAALLAGMMPVSGGQVFFGIVYALSCLAIILGVYAELKHRGRAPFRDWCFYLAGAASAFPVIGPLTVLFMLYAVQGDENREPFKLTGMLASILRLKINPLVIFLFMAILFVLFALTLQQHDPYFK